MGEAGNLCSLILLLKQNMRRESMSKLKPEPERPPDPKLRKCLKCGRRFKSEHFGERVCPKCKGGSDWRGPSFPA